MGRTLAALVALAAAVHSADARAGIRPHIWTWDTNIVPQGDVELEQWLWVRGKIPGRGAAYWTWWGPVFGATDHLEVAVPFQTVGTTSSFFLESFEVDARYRIFSRNDDGKLQPLVRAAFHQAIWSPDKYSRLDADAVLSYGLRDELRVTVDLGAKVFLPFLAPPDPPPDPVRVQVTYAAGVSYPVLEWLRAGVEVFGEIDVAYKPPPPAPQLPHHFVGASLGYQKGKVWITAGMLVGLTADSPQFMPRLIWAVAL